MAVKGFPLGKNSHKFHRHLEAVVVHGFILTSSRVIVVLDDFPANGALKFAADCQALQRDSFVLNNRRLGR